METESLTQLHFIGIGGVGMSGIARVAHDQGITVTGSDLKESRYTKQLKEVGIPVYIGHEADHIPEGNPIVVVSTAILDNNPEYQAAKDRGLTLWHRAQALARLGEGLKTLAVAGTHGKTTTSSMLATVLYELGEDPTFLIGGIVQAFGSNAHSGTGATYVVEADESDKSFRYLSPYAEIITNIEADHLDHYRDLDEIYEKFAAFISSLPQDGIAVVCGEDAPLTTLAQQTGKRILTYGFGETFDIQTSNYEVYGVGSTFNVTLPDGQFVAVELPQNPGRHNALNATGVIGLLWALGFDPARCAEALSHFGGVRRRFDYVGEQNGVTVVDDYAHHPTEIAATIKAAANLDYNHIHVLFQPHRYSRAPLFTEVLRDEFGSAFDEADYLTFMDVYPAGETPVPGVTGKTFLQVVLDHEGHPQSNYVPKRIDVAVEVVKNCEPGDLVITMGAGDVTAMGPEILAELASQAKTQPSTQTEPKATPAVTPEATQAASTRKA